MANAFCSNGHVYDNAVHSTCPYCGVDGLRLDLGPTLAAPDLTPPGRADDIAPTRAARPGNAPPARDHGTPRGEDLELTRAYYPKRLGGIDPVVGWLVCVAGPDRGRDYRLHAERNFIGRDPGMDIVIAGDTGVSRQNHAVISYNPKRHSFSVVPGDARGLAYLNDDELLGPQPLAAWDRLELGATTLLFVPLCGERFTWPAADADGGAAQT